MTKQDTKDLETLDYRSPTSASQAVKGKIDRAPSTEELGKESYNSHYFEHNALQFIINIEDAYAAIAANLELLNPNTPDQHLFSNTLKMSVIELTKEGGVVHSLRKAFE